MAHSITLFIVTIVSDTGLVNVLVRMVVNHLMRMFSNQVKLGMFSNRDEGIRWLLKMRESHVV
jgi:hypothetical protein